MRSMPRSPNAALVEALRRRNLAEVEEAARGLERVEPEHALAIVLLMADEDDVRYEPALIRWAGLWLARHPQVGFELAVDLVRSLAELDRGLPQRRPCERRRRPALSGRRRVRLRSLALVSAARLSAANPL